MSTFWSYYIIAIVVFTLFAISFLLIWTRKQSPEDVAENEALHHSFDGIVELNKPLPRWWLWSFWFTIVFAVVYLILFPGLGRYKGLLDWTQFNQLENEYIEADAVYGPKFAALGQQSVFQLIQNPEAMNMGQRLFLNNCAVCHGSDAGGGPGFPNLRDDHWLYGGTPEAIEYTITNGRNGMMPALGGLIGGEDAAVNVANYVLTLSHRDDADREKAKLGEPLFQQVCASCHMPDGTGNTSLGAPNLTQNVWMYGGHVNDIVNTIMNGRSGTMPAHKDLLGKDKIRVLTSYVYSLSASK